MIEIGLVQVRNFRLLRSASFSLMKSGLVLIRGINNDTMSASSNGSGKSTIFDAPMWALFGDTIMGDPMEVISDGEKTCEVRVALHIDEVTELVIERKLVRGAKGNESSLRLFENGKEISKTTMRLTQAIIEARMGHDFLSARNTVFCAQNDDEDFSATTSRDSQQKRVLKRILRFDVLEAALKLATEEGKAALLKIQKLKAEISKADGVMSVAETDSSPILMKSLKKVATSGPKLTLEWKEAKQEVKDIREELGKLKAVKANIEKLQLQHRDLLIKRDRVETEIRQDKKEAQGIDFDISKWEEGGCPVCNTPASSDHPHAMAYVNGKKAKRLSLLSSASEKAQKAEELVGQAEGLAGQIREMKKEISQEMAWLRVEAKAQEKVTRLDKMIADAAIAKVELARLEELEQDRKALIAESKKKVEVGSKELEGLYEEQLVLDFLIEGFGNKGIASQLMDSVAPTLTSLTNQWLELLSDGYLRVQYNTQGMTKGGKIRDEFSLLVYVNGKPSMPSGGERRKIAAATRIALWQLAKDMGGTDVDLLILDEVLDHLDPKGMERVEMLLLKLREMCGSVYVITHDKSLSEIFESEVVVMRSGNESSIINQENV